MPSSVLSAETCLRELWPNLEEFHIQSKETRSNIDNVKNPEDVIYDPGSVIWQLCDLWEGI